MASGVGRHFHTSTLGGCSAGDSDKHTFAEIRQFASARVLDFQMPALCKCLDLENQVAAVVRRRVRQFKPISLSLSEQIE